VPTSEKTELMRSVNSGIALFATDMPTASGEKWVFVCECGAADCAARLELDLAKYDAMGADAGGEILAAGHVAPSSAQRARREAADTREESRALHAQAKQQVERAHRQLMRARRLSKYPYL
jgi:hypothetical protein